MAADSPPDHRDRPDDAPDAAQTEVTDPGNGGGGSAAPEVDSDDARAARDGRNDGPLPEPRGNPFLAAFLAWILPGAGHFYVGRRGRAAVFFALVVGAALFGVGLEGKLWRAVPGQLLSYLGTGGCMGLGIPYLVLRFLFDYAGNPVAQGYEYGGAFLLTAGLMNLLLVLDAWDLSRGVKP